MNNIVVDISEPGLLIDASFDLVSDTNHDKVGTDVPAEMSIPNEMPIPVSFVSSYDEKHTKAAQQWQNSITSVGQRFNSVHEFREALRKYAIAHQFAFKYKKNDSDRVTVKCKAEGCPWRIHASRLSTTALFCIKKMNPTHTCEGSVGTNGCKATRSWIASVVKEKLAIYPNYKPKDIVDDIKREYGIQLNYFQAWRGKEIAREQLQGSYREAYSQLPFFCNKIMDTNPGSRASFTTKEDSSFQRLFVSFHASLYGFEHGCRPLLFLDSLFLKAKYQGSLLAATAADGNDGFFPVAFAVVDVESEENWRWFLLELKMALSNCRGLTFVADRAKGLRESISEVFPDEDVYHGFCLANLSEQLLQDLKGNFSPEVRRILVDDLWTAALAPTPEGFHRCMESIKNISAHAHDWIMQSEPVHWANAFFRGARYNHLASNFGEPFYRWVREAHELPITQMVDAIRGKITELLCSRRAESVDWLSQLTPVMEEKLEKESAKARTLQVLISAGKKFEVIGETADMTDVDNWDCTCKGWQLTGLPCRHAIAVISCLDRSMYDYCSKYFTVESYKTTYSQSILPTSNMGVAAAGEKSGSELAVTVTPPPTRRPRGRPTTKKAGPQDGRKRRILCSRCKGTGHNKSNCKEFLVDC
ncbi:uncharacterized protein LOC127252469 isoform X2 [Andrographis paniculata]|nr:uncharacterized protein LOC127252469 isoform X2 [Andrographis paniculata]